MGYYAERILPRILDWGMRGKAFARERKAALAEARGVVLEVGFGTGHNLPYYPPGVERLYAVEPSALAHRLARRRIEAAPFPVEIVGLVGERIPLGDASVDTVVTTWTLCTIADPLAALAEMKRVLRPAGRYLFVEHGRSDDPRVARWQDRLTPIQKRIGGGCHLNRRIDELVRAGGFRIERLERTTMPGPRVATALYRGIAVPDGAPTPAGATI